MPLEIGFGRATCTFSRTSGGSHVLVNQAAEQGFSADLASVEFCHSDARRVVLAVGDALGDALVRPGGVVAHLVFRQDGADAAHPPSAHLVHDVIAKTVLGVTADNG